MSLFERASTLIAKRPDLERHEVAKSLKVTPNNLGNALCRGGATFTELRKAAIRKLMHDATWGL